jgi:transposase
MSSEKNFVGIDVSKETLDIAVIPNAQRWKISYNEKDLQALTKRLKELHPTLIVLEATGGLETPLVSSLAIAELPVSVVNPRQVRDFAKAIGKLAKTDTIDAGVLAEFAAKIRPTPRPIKDQKLQDLTALNVRRQQLVDMISAEKNRLKGAPK